MVGTRTKTARGLVVLALAGAVAGAALAGPVTAAAPLATKKFVKKQVKRLQNNLNNLSSNVIHNPVYYRQSAPVSLPAVAGSFDEAFVACPTGTSPLGGGVAPAGVFGPPPVAYWDINVRASHPSTGTNILPGTTGWSVGVENEVALATSFRAYVICAAVQKDSNFAEGAALPRAAEGPTRD